MIRSILLICFLAFSFSLLGQTEKSKDNHQQNMDEAMEQMTHMFDSLDIKKIFEQSYSEISKEIDQIDVDQLKEMMKMSVKMLEDINPEDIKNQIEDLEIESQMKALIEKLNLDEFEELMSKQKPEKDTKTKKI